MLHPVCPVCSAQRFTTLVPFCKIEEETRLREQFVNARLARTASSGERKDLTDFFHQAKAEILECAGCTLLYRNELERPPAADYSEDEYNPAAIEQVYPRYLAAFRAKEKPFRSLLPPRARVVEIGSHYGAFLETAREWGWRAEGVDIGEDTSRFARSKGFTVHVCELRDCGFPAHSLDGVFIWNCFEQIPDPQPLLAESRRILKPGGLLVVRMPNGLFYANCHKLLLDPGLQSHAAEFLMEAMAYNNLLGFPYLYGHSRATLERLIEPPGYRFETALNSELLTLPLPESPDWVRREERSITSQIRLLANSILKDQKGVLTGPWLEACFRTGAV